MRSLTWRPQQQCCTQTHTPGTHTTRLVLVPAQVRACKHTRPHCPLRNATSVEAPLTHWAQPQSPTGDPMDQSPIAPTFTHGDLKAQGCDEAGGLTPANVSRTRGGPTASYTGHGWPSKWLAPAPWLAPALTSVAICLHLPSLGLVATCPPAHPPAHPALRSTWLVCHL